MQAPKTQHPCNIQAAQALQATGGVQDVQQRQLSGKAQCSSVGLILQPFGEPLSVPASDPVQQRQLSGKAQCSSVGLVLQAFGEPPSVAASDPVQPASVRQHRQTAQTDSTGPWLEPLTSGDDCVRDVGAGPPSDHMPVSWGLRKPRTRHRPRQSDRFTTDLAVVAAAATAEAEQAAASAVARAHIDYDEAASQSGAQQPHSKRLSQESFRQTRQGLRSRSLPPRSGAAPQQTYSFDSRGYPDPGPSIRPPRQALEHKGGPRTGRNHHRAGALPSNLHKETGYIGSNWLGVNGIRHGPEFPLRWKAGTWDPVLKKTVYIGSFDLEIDAAKAVDAWHISCGRAPVNFMEPDPQPPSSHARTYKQQTQANASATNRVQVTSGSSYGIHEHNMSKYGIHEQKRATVVYMSRTRACCDSVTMACRNKRNVLHHCLEMTVALMKTTRSLS